MSETAVESRWWYWIVFELVLSAFVGIAYYLNAFLVTLALLALLVIVRVIVLVAYVADTRAITAADVEWKPSGLNYAVMAFFFPYLAAPIYLGLRHIHVGVP